MAAQPPPVSIHAATFITAREHAARHRVELEASATCGCFSCFRRFPTADIKAWVEDNQTALCPHCGLDTVLGSASPYQLSDQFLRRMNQHHFSFRSR